LFFCQFLFYILAFPLHENQDKNQVTADDHCQSRCDNRKIARMLVKNDGVRWLKTNSTRNNFMAKELN